ncbi:hypothetical protein [Aeromicrobium sp.]|uniref:hypothetical protein n=1 Tax=Aeromicrobium sp. TaxID=1871063 RepID=UPI003C5C6D93
MRWGRKADEDVASNEVADDPYADRDAVEGGAHADTTRVDYADAEYEDAYEQDQDDVDRASVVEREREALGGVKVGSAFFGWLAATGMAVLLTALVTAGGAAVSIAQGNDAEAPTVETIGLTEAVVLLVIFFVAYYCGGYVASRMARFNGMKQGFAVWIWALVIAVIVSIGATVAGDKYDVLSNLNNFPRIPTNEGDVTTNGIIAALAIAAVTLVGAIMGGLAGMRFHRKVDRAGLGR